MNRPETSKAQINAADELLGPTLARGAADDIAILFGDSERHIIALLQAMTLLALYLVGRLAHLGPWYLAGLAAGAVFFLYHLWLIRGREPDACFHAFLNNHYFGMAVFIGICLSYVF